MAPKGHRTIQPTTYTPSTPTSTPPFQILENCLTQSRRSDSETALAIEDHNRTDSSG